MSSAKAVALDSGEYIRTGAAAGQSGAEAFAVDRPRPR
jgi:hypothetical protein